MLKKKKKGETKEKRKSKEKKLSRDKRKNVISKERERRKTNRK